MGLLIAALAVAGASIVSGLITSSAASEAAKTQAGAAQQGIDAITEQNKKTEELLKPYTETGKKALSEQEILAGLGGEEAQKAAIDRISGSPEMAAMLASGENAILQNASATGGLRGGNTQSALAQFRPALLSSLIQKQYERLGGLSQMGQNSAMGQAGYGAQSASAIADLLGQKGAAQAGGQIAAGQGFASIPNGILNGLGFYAGAGGKF